MHRNWVKYIMTVSLLVIFINRALFVAMPGVEISCSSNDVNTLLETIFNWAGIHNDIDEDGDSPENYNAASSVQPLIDNIFSRICITCPFTSLNKLFNVFNDAVTLLDAYGTIDHPPEIT